MLEEVKSRQRVVEIQIHFKRRIPPERKRGNRGYCGNLLFKIRDWLEDFGEGPMTFKHVDVSFPMELVREWGLITYVKAPDTQDGWRDGRVGTSADMSNHVYSQIRVYSSDGYTTVGVPVFYEDALSGMLYALDIISRETKFFFPVTQLYLSPVPPNYKEFFCTQYVTTVLQQMKLLRGMNPSAQTADDLYEKLITHHKKTPVVPPYQRRKEAERRMRNGNIGDEILPEDSGIMDNYVHHDMV